MTEQMTATGVLILCTAIALFWAGIGILVRVHAHRRRTRPHTREAA
jgi:hypothetical protein